MVEIGFGHRWGDKVSSGRWLWRFLVGGALIAFLALLLMIAQRDRNITHLKLEEGQQQVIRLSDAQRIELEGQGELAYVDPEARWTFRNLARLSEGEAHFYLDEGATGFVVETPSAQIVVQGDVAHFRVTSGPDTTGTTVSRGAVTIAPSENPHAGRRVELNEQARTTSRHIVGN